ncbi:UNVERIFIED_CONTAM: putative membrane protein [Acetivibrio alkalicellulosi]
MKGKKNNKKITSHSKSKKNILIILGSAIILMVVIFIIKGNFGGEVKTALSEGGDLLIPKNEITENVSFFPLKVENTNMEILAVRASDGSIRTAFNTCQVCNGSPKAYYKQEGDVVVCQNCGNRFAMDMIEQQRGGCNPIPIMKDNKKDVETNIIIAGDYIARNKNMFTSNWKTR